MIDYFDPNEIEVGSILQLVWVRSYQHGATMRVTKVNKKSFVCVEVKGSYGGPCDVGHPVYKNGREATTWRIHKDSNYTWIKNYDNPEFEGKPERLYRSYPTHYDWDI